MSWVLSWGARCSPSTVWYWLEVWKARACTVARGVKARACTDRGGSVCTLGIRSVGMRWRIRWPRVYWRRVRRSCVRSRMMMDGEGAVVRRGCGLSVWRGVDGAGAAGGWGGGDGGAVCVGGRAGERGGGSGRPACPCGWEAAANGRLWGCEVSGGRLYVRPSASNPRSDRRRCCCPCVPQAYRVYDYVVPGERGRGSRPDDRVMGLRDKRVDGGARSTRGRRRTASGGAAGAGGVGADDGCVVAARTHQ